MPLTKKNYSNSLKNLPEEVRNKAIEIGNALIEAEREKEMANENLRILFKNIGEAFFSIGLVDMKFMHISDACQGIYGYNTDSFMNNPNHWLNVIHPLDHRVKSLLDLKEITRTITVEYRIIKPDETVCWVETKLVPGFDGQGNLYRVDGVTTNINSRKLAEQKLASKITELKTLMYRLSHDLRGPLASTAGLINVSKLEVKDEVAVKYLEMIEHSNNKLDKVLQSIVQVVSIDNYSESKEKINFDKIVQSICKLYQNIPDTENINFSTKISLQKDFHSKEHYIRSILYNLIDNAVSYRNNVDPLVNISIMEEKGLLQMHVKDNGWGIDPQLQEKIFLMFFRGHEQSRGPGLGLYIVKNIVDKLNGSITFKSEKDAGTEFHVLLPFGVSE